MPSIWNVFIKFRWHDEKLTAHTLSILWKKILHQFSLLPPHKTKRSSVFLQSSFSFNNVHSYITSKLKSDNLQYDTLVRWDKWLVHQASDVPSIIFFFMISCKMLCKNVFNVFFYKFTKIKTKSFECPKSNKIWKNNTWNVRHLVDESFVSSAQQTSVSYCRLSDFRSCCLFNSTIV